MTVLVKSLLKIVSIRYLPTYFLYFQLCPLDKLNIVILTKKKIYKAETNVFFFHTEIIITMRNVMKSCLHLKKNNRTIVISRTIHSKLHSKFRPYYYLKVKYI